MKNINILRIASIMILTLLFYSAKAENINPKSETSFSKINNTYVSYSHGKQLDSKLLRVSYDNSKAYFCLDTKDSIVKVQILNEAGELEFQVPMNNKRLYISMNNFDEGVYYVNLQFETDSAFISSKLIKK